MTLTGPGEERTTGAGLLPHLEWILQWSNRERERGVGKTEREMCIIRKKVN